MKYPILGKGGGEDSLGSQGFSRFITKFAKLTRHGDSAAAIFSAMSLSWQAWSASRRLPEPSCLLPLEHGRDYFDWGSEVCGQDKDKVTLFLGQHGQGGRGSIASDAFKTRWSSKGGWQKSRASMATLVQ